jgi:hypothetical protein
VGQHHHGSKVFRQWQAERQTKLTSEVRKPDIIRPAVSVDLDMARSDNRRNIPADGEGPDDRISPSVIFALSHRSGRS